jgi:hypothetical protein
MKYSRKGMVASVLPGILLLLLFYSIAIHMRLSLGTWAASIGEDGFSRLLSWHAALTVDYFSLFFLSFLASPVVIVPCLMKEKWRGAVPYFALFALSFLLSWALMQFAPGQFLSWWRD